MIELSKPFFALKNYHQFIIYKLVPRAGNPGKSDKIPYSPYAAAIIIDAHDDKHWAPFETASRMAQQAGADYGVGFVLTRNDPFFCVDIDSAWNGSEWSTLSTELLAALPGAAVEVSTSNTGLHIFGITDPVDHATKPPAELNLGIELYTHSRFIALTGTHASGDIETDCTESLARIIEQYFTVRAPSAPAPAPGGAREDWNGPVDDNDLIQRALRSSSIRSAITGRATFADLWNRNETVLSQTYPSSSGEPFDRSAADQALAQHLAFWTGCDRERIHKLMLQSQLVRDKWQRDDYMHSTITFAISHQLEVCRDKPVEPNIQAEITGHQLTPERITGNTILVPDQQRDFFKGCIYVTDAHAILTPKGYLLKPDQFKVVYGGRTFLLDDRNEKTSRDPWKVVTESQSLVFPRTDTTCFRPDLAPGAIVNIAGELQANIYWPVPVKRTMGDISPFLRHLHILIPNEEDRMFFLCYLCACVQFPGHKFRWAPLMVGMPGNGKTLFTLCVARAIGMRYCHFPNAKELDSQFNGWMYGNIFIGVEDVFVKEKWEVFETLKPMITGEYQEIQPKNKDQKTREVCCNFIFNSNHKDALRKTDVDRRIANFFNPQWTIADLERDGLTNAYFVKLWHWLNHEDGFAIVAEYLHSFQIPDSYNPKYHSRAPITTSTPAAIEAGRDVVEQEILEAVQEGRIGFRGGWISSYYLGKLLESLRADKRYPVNKRTDLMRVLGYLPHPYLTGGRVNNPVMPDGIKSRLYILKGHSNEQIRITTEISHAYTRSQSNE